MHELEIFHVVHHDPARLWVDDGTGHPLPYGIYLDAYDHRMGLVSYRVYEQKWGPNWAVRYFPITAGVLTLAAGNDLLREMAPYARRVLAHRDAYNQLVAEHVESMRAAINAYAHHAPQVRHAAAVFADLDAATLGITDRTTDPELHQLAEHMRQWVAVDVVLAGLPQHLATLRRRARGHACV